MSCINECGISCCDAPARLHFTKCVGPCKRRLQKIGVCSGDGCGHLVTIQTFIWDTVQFCLGTVLPCLYVCRDCLKSLRNVTRGLGEVDRFTLSLPKEAFAHNYNPLRLWSAGDEFEYMTMVFWSKDYDAVSDFTIRKRFSIHG